jgi:hypothetical protein
MSIVKNSGDGDDFKVLSFQQPSFKRLTNKDKPSTYQPTYHGAVFSGVTKQITHQSITIMTESEFEEMPIEDKLSTMIYLILPDPIL